MQLPRPQFQAAIELANLDPDALHEDYSGRGMYGKTCPALYLDRPTQAYAFMSALGAVMTSESDAGDVWEVVELAGSTNVDSMGLGVVVYWPSLELTG